MAHLVPVDHDPFASVSGQPNLVPVDHDPFSPAAKKVAVANKRLEQYGAAITGAADSASFGLGDEVGATIGAWPALLTNKMDYGTTRDKLLEKNRQGIKAMKERNPGAFLAGQVAGAVGTGAGLTKAFPAVANSFRGSEILGRNLGLAGRMLKGGAAGAASLGAYGFNSGEGIDDRLEKGGTGVVGGGLLGAALPAAGYVAGGVASNVKPAVQRVGAIFGNQGAQESIANNILAKRLLSEGFTPDEVIAKVAQAKASGLSPTLGESLNSSGVLQAEKSVVRGTGKGANMMRNALNERNRTTIPKTLGGFADRLDKSAGDVSGLYRAAADEAEANIARQNIAPVIRVKGVTAGGDLPLTETAAGLPSESMKVANSIGQNIRQRLARMGKVSNEESKALRQAQVIIENAKRNGGDFAALHDAQKQLDNIFIENADGAVQARAKTHVASYRKQISDTLKTLAPQNFKAANKASMTKMAAGDIREALQSTNEGSLGVLYNKVWAKPELRTDFLRKLPDDETRRQAANLFTQLENVKRGFGGSDTAFNLPANQQLAQEAGLGFNPMSLNPFETAPKFLNWLASRSQPGVYDKLAKQAVNPDAQAIANAMGKLTGKKPTIGQIMRMKPADARLALEQLQKK